MKWPGGLEVWAGTSWMGKTELHFIPRSFKAQDYIDFLREKAIPDLTRLYPHKCRPPILLQDGEGFHTELAGKRVGDAHAGSEEEKPHHFRWLEGSDGG